MVIWVGSVVLHVLVVEPSDGIVMTQPCSQRSFEKVGVNVLVSVVLVVVVVVVGAQAPVRSEGAIRS